MKEKNIFQKIIDKDIFAHILYEDDDFLVFLDAYPQNPGHTLIIPKEDVRWVWDVEKYEDYLKLVRNISFVLRKAFNTDWIISKIIGDEVPHAHIHLIPGGIKKDGSEKKFEEIKKKIIKHINKTTLYD